MCMRCAVCSVRCAVCGVRCAVCGVQYAVCSSGSRPSSGTPPPLHYRYITVTLPLHYRYSGTPPPSTPTKPRASGQTSCSSLRTLAAGMKPSSTRPSTNAATCIQYTLCACGHHDCARACVSHDCVYHIDQRGHLRTHASGVCVRARVA